MQRGIPKIEKVTVVGTGIMGHGIDQTFALRGYEVTLNDVNDELLEKAIRQIRISKIISFIEDEEVIEKILKHLGLWDMKA
jgi:3-hydroxyacyl-CoA dehydrogenase